MPGNRAITLRGLLAFLAVAVLVFATCRHGFYVSEGGKHRLGFPESSGLVSSRTHEGVFWTHADSGTPPYLFAIGSDGGTLAQFTVAGVRNVDWEDVAIDDSGNLYIADIGNNFNNRRDLVVYRIREPDPASGGGEVGVEARLRFRYPDQLEFPASVPNFDAESLFWSRGRLYLLTKHRGDTHTTLYRFPRLDGRTEVVLDRISDFDLGGQTVQFGGMATAADISPDGEFLALLSYHALFLFRAPAEGDDYLSVLHKRVDLKMTRLVQCEAVAWDGEDLVITNETGRVFRIRNVLDPTLTEFPSD